MNRDAQVDSIARRLIDTGFGLRPIKNAPWVESIEKRLGYSYPRSFRSFVTRYSFPYLEFEEVKLFSNLGDRSEYDLTTAPFRDHYLGPWLIERRLVYIGHPYLGDYDPICLDLEAGKPGGEPPVVRLDHEDILLERRKVAKATVASTFLALLEAQIQA